MKCYCCGKEITTVSELNYGWHLRCIKKFFGTSSIPSISLKKDVLDNLANSSVNKGLTVPGVQKKISLHLEKEKHDARFTLVNYPTGYILKPQSGDYEELPEAEHLAMTMARQTGISVVPFSLLKIDHEFAFITKRIDRKDDEKYAMEDFCQISGRNTLDKYKGSYEECGKIIKKYSCRSGLDLSEFFLRLVFCHVIGNSDMHLKNFSLIESAPGKREYILAPAYDLLPVNIVMPKDKDFSALTLNGKKRNMKKNNFLSLAENIGLNEKAARNSIMTVINKKRDYELLVKDSYVSDEFKEKLIQLMNERISLLD